MKKPKLTKQEEIIFREVMVTGNPFTIIAEKFELSTSMVESIFMNALKKIDDELGEKYKSNPEFIKHLLDTQGGF